MPWSIGVPLHPHTKHTKRNTRDSADSKTLLGPTGLAEATGRTTQDSLYSRLQISLSSDIAQKLQARAAIESRPEAPTNLHPTERIQIESYTTLRQFHQQVALGMVPNSDFQGACLA